MARRDPVFFGDATGDHSAGDQQKPYFLLDMASGSEEKVNAEYLRGQQPISTLKSVFRSAVSDRQS